MPQTIHGIGTHYYGRSNLRLRPGTCDGCGRGGILSSYDTRLWLVLLFIPIIPLRKRRVLDQCGICHRHRAMALEEWNTAKNQAMEEGMKKVVDHPGDLQALSELHETCLRFGEWEKGDRLAERIEKEFPDEAKAHVHLAAMHAYRGRDEAVRTALERARALDPTLEQPAPTRGPTGGKPSGVARRQRILLGILALLVVGGLLISDRFKVSHRTLYVLNGFESLVTVEIPNVGTASVAPLSHRAVDLPEGSYVAHVTGAVREDIPFDLSSSFIVRVFEDRQFILNPGGAGLLLREEAVYHPAGSSSDEGSGGYALFYGRNFLTFDHIDFPFREFPAEIEMKSSDEKRKTRLAQVVTSPADYVESLLEERKVVEALNLAEWAIDARPSRTDVLANYVSAAEDPARRERVNRWLESRISRRPVNIPLHRAYQDLLRATDHASLVAAYEAMLQSEPGNSSLLYLRGRLAPGISQSAGWFEKAVAADRKNAYAHFALAYGYHSRGLWKEAQESNEEACRLEPQNSMFRDQLDLIRHGTGQWDLLEQDLRNRWTTEGRRAGRTLTLLAAVTAFRRNRDAGFQVCEEYRRAQPQSIATIAGQVAAALRCRVLYVTGDFSSLEAEAAKAPKNGLQNFRQMALVELGRLDEAEALAGTRELDPVALLTRSIAWGLQGKDARAADLRKKAATLLEKGEAPWAGLARLLSASEPPTVESVMEMDLPPGLKALVLTALGQAFPSSASTFSGAAARLNVSLEYPHHLLARALASLEKKP
jgi:tetratricopeptide (TPR) repeat protein